jgi:hypothetical protein
LRSFGELNFAEEEEREKKYFCKKYLLVEKRSCNFAAPITRKER